MHALARIDHAALAPDTAVASVRAREALSRSFDVSVHLTSVSGSVDLAGMLGSSASVVIEPHGEGPARFFHGIVDEARYLGADGSRHHYRLRLRPHIDSLAHRVRSRIFQAKTTDEIVRRVLEDAGFAPGEARFELVRALPPREYCCQWKESELAFVRRLLENEGIFFWFEHCQAEHVMCFGDAPSVHLPIEGDTALGVRRHPDQETESFWDPLLRARAVHDAYLCRDFDAARPGAPLEASCGEAGMARRYEYPARGDAAYARARLEEAWCERVVLEARSDCPRAEPGRKLVLTGASSALFAGEHLLIELEHRFEAGPDARLGHYENRFCAIPSEVPYRPRRVTPRPRVAGLESAVVTGPPGEEIHVDDLGRIKVQFYWDREGALDDTSSAWVRVQQLNTSGAMILPRVGWEVHVAFADGDPDRPIALHRAYNQETAPPYALPASKTRGALQSSTSPGGGNTNELRFEDASGAMELFVHASRDLAVTVDHDETERVGVDLSESAGATYHLRVGGSERGTIGGDQTIDVAADVTASTAGKKVLAVGGNDDTGVSLDLSWTTAGDRRETIGGAMNVLANTVVESFGANHTREVGAVLSILSATSIAETIGGNKTESTGGAKVIVTPGPYEEQIGGVKTLSSGAVLVSTEGDMQHATKGAFALTAIGRIALACAEACSITGSQLRVTSGSAAIEAGGSRLALGASVTIDAKKFAGAGGVELSLKGNIDYK